ncbi:MFS transporter [Patescibacteria group bacterium]|nr:MFS transporter [Patescibacteria group bacterium]MBU0964361.1 MFS transporter [Patescibacteria group bacterium]
MAIIKRGLKILYFTGFVLAMSKAFPGYIQSTFLQGFVDVKWVGLFFIGSAVFSLLAINFFPILIKKFTNYRLSLIVLSLNIISILLLITVHSPYLVFLFFIIAGVCTKLLWINMDVFVERLTDNKTTGRTRTTYFTFINLGWVASPLIVGYLVGDENYRFIYLLSAFFMMSVLAVFVMRKDRLAEHIQYNHHHTLITLKHIAKNIGLRGIFIIAFLLELFFAMAVIYIPIYLHQNLSFSWLTIGGIFTFMLLPFVIFQIPAGVLADKYASEKKIFALGFLIISASCALFFFIESSSPVVWALLLFLSRCGASLIQAMRESYFFKIVDVQDIDYINFFRNLSPLGYLVGSGLSVLILQFLPIQYLFLGLSIILLSGLYFAWRLPTIKSKS